MNLWETKEPLLENHPRKGQNGWKRDVFTCKSRAVFLLQADSGVFTVVSLSALPGKGASSPSCPVWLNEAGDPA